VDGKERVFGGTSKNPLIPCHAAWTNVLVMRRGLHGLWRDGFLHTSDAEDLRQKEQRSFVTENDPDVLFIDGPLTCMPGCVFSDADHEGSIDRIGEVLKKCDTKKMAIDRHPLLDLRWRELEATRIRRRDDDGRRNPLAKITPGRSACKALPKSACRAARNLPAEQSEIDC